MTYVVIPAKGFNGAKQRLATFLRPHERARLAQAMLTDTLTACCRAQGLAGVGVVTCDRGVAKVVESLGAEVLWEPQAQGHSQAVAFGVHVCTQRGLASMLTMRSTLSLFHTFPIADRVRRASGFLQTSLSKVPPNRAQPPASRPALATNARRLSGLDLHVDLIPFLW